MAERWKRIKGTFHYWISDQGRVYRERCFTTYFIGKGHIRQQWIKGRFLKPYLAGGHGKHKYLYVNISGHRYPIPVHRLVAEAFVAGKDDEHYEINHIDNNPLNNNASNLEWCDRAYNTSLSNHTGPRKPHDEWKRDEAKIAKSREYHKYLEGVNQKRRQIKEEQQFLRTIKPEGWQEKLRENINLKKHEYKRLSMKEWEDRISKNATA